MQNWQRRIVEGFLVFLILNFTGCGTGEKTPLKVSRIYFGTNRAVSFSGGNLDSNDKPGNQLLLGNLDVSIDEGYKALQFSNMTPRGGAILSREAFVADIRSQMRTEGDDILVFIHGFNNSFLDALKTVLQMKTDQNLRGPMFAFSWPSAGSSLEYLGDEQQATSNITAQSFRQMLDLILENSTGKRVHLLAHSMGNRVLLEGLRSYAIAKGNTTGITTAVFVAPDEQLAIFKGTLELVLSKSDATKFSLYVNRNDWALQASKTLRDTLVNGDDSRTGAHDPQKQSIFGNENFSSWGANGEKLNKNITNNFRLIDVSNLSRTGNVEHAYFRDNALVVDDLSHLLQGKEGSRRLKHSDVSCKPYFTILPESGDILVTPADKTCR